MRILSITQKALSGILILGLSAISVFCARDAYGEDAGLGGDTYFDFAFRDSAGILFRGTDGGGEVLAQDDAEDAEEPENQAGQGLSQPSTPSVAPDALFRVGLCLPAGPRVSDAEVCYIAKTLKSALVA